VHEYIPNTPAIKAAIMRNLEFADKCGFVIFGCHSVVAIAKRTLAAQGYTYYRKKGNSKSKQMKADMRIYAVLMTMVKDGEIERDLQEHMPGLGTMYSYHL